MVTDDKSGRQMRRIRINKDQIKIYPDNSIKTARYNM